ncbi:hypothetical protein SGRIM128S_04566 [Streptomyces griseomycini]
MCSAATRSSRRAVSSKRRAVPCSSRRASRAAAVPTGSRRASSSSCPAAAAASCPGSSRRSWRRAVEKGAKGSPSAPSTQPPSATTAPRAAGRRGELLEEAGLADAGLTADQQRLARTVGGPGERVVQRVEFRGAADEHGTDGLGLHGPEHPTGLRRPGTGFHGDGRAPGGVRGWRVPGRRCPGGRRSVPGRRPGDGGDGAGSAAVPGVRARRGPDEPVAAVAAGMALGSGTPCGGFAAGGAAEADRLTGLPLLLGPADEVVVAELLELVLEHGGSPWRSRCRTSLSAMPPPSSVGWSGHIGRVPHLRRPGGP